MLSSLDQHRKVGVRVLQSAKRSSYAARLLVASPAVAYARARPRRIRPATRVKPNPPGSMMLRSVTPSMYCMTRNCPPSVVNPVSSTPTTPGWSIRARLPFPAGTSDASTWLVYYAFRQKLAVARQIHHTHSAAAQLPLHDVALFQDECCHACCRPQQLAMCCKIAAAPAPGSTNAWVSLPRAGSTSCRISSSLPRRWCGNSVRTAGSHATAPSKTAFICCRARLSSYFVVATSGKNRAPRGDARHGQRRWPGGVRSRRAQG